MGSVGRSTQKGSSSARSYTVQTVEPVPEEIEMMFDSLADSEKHFEYVKPKRSINQASLNDNKHNLKSNQL